MTPPIRLPALLIPLAFAAGCAHRAPAAVAPAKDVVLACPRGGDLMQRSVLYFGAAIPNSNDTVDAAEWQAFLDRDVTPRFPDGLTWFEARGQWRGNDGQVIGEASRVLILLHGDGDGDAIEAIRSAYKQTFAQEAVMVEREPSCVAF